MPPDVQARIFEQSFTTKPVGKGTGLGLAISYEIIVNNHNGQIHYSSTPGQGTKCTIALPINSSSSSVTKHNSLLGACK